MKHLVTIVFCVCCVLLGMFLAHFHTNLEVASRLLAFTWGALMGMFLGGYIYCASAKGRYSEEGKWLCRTVLGITLFLAVLFGSGPSRVGMSVGEVVSLMLLGILSALAAWITEEFVRRNTTDLVTRPVAIASVTSVLGFVAMFMVTYLFTEFPGGIGFKF